MNPYECWMIGFGCSSYQQLHSELESIAKDDLGLDGVPFPLSALEHPPWNIKCPEVINFLGRCTRAVAGVKSEAQAIQLVQYLKENPPKESYKNPELSNAECTRDEMFLFEYIFWYGIDLPGSRHNPFGHLQYYSSFFIDMYFGNYTDFNDHVQSLSKEELQIALNKREGYCQMSPTFAPIHGLRMIDIETRCIFTRQQVKEIRSMFTLCNENEHLNILKELIKLGADVNAHDIHGFTPLHYAIYYNDEGMVTVLLKHGANPNSESRTGSRPLTILKITPAGVDPAMNLVDILVQFNAKLTNKKHVNELRTTVETRGCKDLAIRVREAHPRGKEECEKCLQPAPKKCTACVLVYYCSTACQKMDWKFHKVSCRKKRDR